MPNCGEKMILFNFVQSPPISWSHMLNLCMEKPAFMYYSAALIAVLSVSEQPAASYGGITDSPPEEHPEDPEQHANQPGGTDTFSR